MKKITEEKILQVNPFEKCIFPKSLRACVGNNSGVHVNSRDCSIIDGYKDAVQYMMEKICSQEATIDTLVYPILFCCRHSVELSLKVLLKNFIIIYKRKNNITTTDKFISDLHESLKGHNIETLVKSIDKIMFIDPEIEKVMSDIKFYKECISDYYFDIDGDSFRYTFKRNWKDTNLEDIRLIDLGVFYEKYSYLMKNLDYLINDFSRWLDYQYRNQIFTKYLNRKQIEEISKLLPNINDWKSEDFRLKKQSICKQYNISNTELTNAIEIIKNHYKFCTNIGMEKKFKNIREETFKNLGKLISESKNLNRETSEKMYINITEVHKYSYFSQDYEIKAEKVFNNINQEEKVALISFYEISLNCFDGSYQCEELDELYKCYENDGFNDEHIDMICRSLTNNHMRKSFEKCGQITYLKWFDKYIKPNI